MFAKSLTIVAAMCISSVAAAQPPAKANIASPARPAAARGAVLDNIIGRVQMDALINTIVASDNDAPKAERRNVAYAEANAARLRNRS